MKRLSDIRRKRKMTAYTIGASLGKRKLDVTTKANERMLETGIIEIHPALRRHIFQGFGGALTESSGYTLSILNEAERRKVLSAFFNPDGPVYDCLRVPIDSSDFSLSQHSACHTLEDWKERRFDFSEEEKYIFPWLDEIYQYSKRRLPILFSPWSPPAFFKDNNSRLRGGRLKDEYYPDWAEYIAIYLNEFVKRGYNVGALTIQNEPNAIQTWDSCLYSPEEERKFLMEYLRPELTRNGLDEIKIYYWDHNKERLLSFAQGFVDRESRNAVSGIAFHGYCGDHFEALDAYRKMYPGHEMILSEFCLLQDCIGKNIRQLDELGHEYINDITHGTELIIDWNIVLDEKGGPNHVGNFCTAPFMKSGDKVKPNMTYTVISELAKAGRKNTVLQTTIFDSSIDCVAFITENGTINFVLKNKKQQTINIRIHDRLFVITPRSNTLVVMSFEKSDYE